MPRIPIQMPQLGESIAEATVVQFNVAEGEEVKADQEIIEVETQKATMTVTTPCGGKVAELSATVEESYPVGATLGFLEVSEEDAASFPVHHAPEPPREELPHAEERPHFAVEDTEEFTQPQVTPTIEGLPVPASATGATYLSPRMRARMTDLGMNAADLAGIAGSGAGGRVTVDDFEAFMRTLEASKMTPASPMRIAVADSMRRSWTRPLATVGSPIVLDSLIAHRKAADPKPGVTLYLMRALAIALSENTAVAGRLIGERIVHPNAIDIGFAVEVEDGVLVPVIRDVERKPLVELIDVYNELIDAALKRRLPDEAKGQPGIATVTNFGTFGIVWATPIPLPEQNLVLGLGRGYKRANWDEVSESWYPVTEAAMTLSFDHRVLDGGAAGRLLARVGELVQDPDAL